MQFDEQTGDVTLSSGRRFAAFTGILGLSLDATLVTVGGELTWVQSGPPDWTPEERAEIADAMIARWQSFKDST